jgi:hypothetical protein
MYNPVVDLQQEDNGDLFFDVTTGDFKLQPSDTWHIKDILQSSPGWWKNSPNIGASLFQSLKSRASAQSIESSVKLELQRDRYMLTRPFVKFDANGNVTIDLSFANIKRLQ